MKPAKKPLYLGQLLPLIGKNKAYKSALNAISAFLGSQVNIQETILSQNVESMV